MKSRLNNLPCGWTHSPRGQITWRSRCVTCRLWLDFVLQEFCPDPVGGFWSFWAGSHLGAGQGVLPVDNLQNFKLRSGCFCPACSGSDGDIRGGFTGPVAYGSPAKVILSTWDTSRVTTCPGLLGTVLHFADLSQVPLFQDN